LSVYSLIIECSTERKLVIQWTTNLITVLALKLKRCSLSHSAFVGCFNMHIIVFVVRIYLVN